MSVSPIISTSAETAEVESLSVSARPPRAEELVCNVIESFADLEKLAPAWDQLWRDQTGLSIFQNFRWVRAFWRAYGEGLQLCSMVARHHDHVVGILPLVLEQGEFQFLGMQESDYNDVVCRGEHSREVIHAFARYLFELPVTWRRGLLVNVPSGSRLSRGIRHLPRDLRRHFQSVFYMPCPTIRLERDRDETLRRLLQKESLKRHENRLKKLGVLTFRHLHDRDELRRHLDTFFEQHTARHLVAGDFTSLPLQFQRSRSREFYRALVDELDPFSELRFALLELDGRPVAYHLGFESKGTYLWYKPTFNVDYWDYSPGEVLLRNLLSYARDSKLREFDFTIGDEPFKQRFANCCKQNLAIYIERNPATPRSLSLSAIRTGNGWVRHTPQVLNFARSMRKLYQRIVQSRTDRSIRARARRLLQDDILKFVLSREDVLLFKAVPSSRHNPPRHESITPVCEATLSDLTQIAVEYPGFLNSSHLQTARKQFRQGARAYIATQYGAAHVIWCRDIETVGPPGTRKACLFPVENKTRVLEVHSSATTCDPQSLARALRYVIAKENVPQLRYTFCHVKDVLYRQVCEAAGFSPVWRATAITFFGIPVCRLRPLGPLFRARAECESSSTI